LIKVGFISLGCAKNLVDSEMMIGLITQNGIMMTDNPEEAEVIIINSCTFIDSAKEESITTILEMAEFKKKGKCKSLILAGCLGQRYPVDVLKEIPEVDVIVGTGSWPRIIEAIDIAQSGRRCVLRDDPAMLTQERKPRKQITAAHTAYLKIAEGCNHSCAFCVIPSLRGPLKSRSIEMLVEEAQILSDQGVKEIILIAQDTTSYGLDLYGKPMLPQLLRQLAANNSLKWIRIMYSYPHFFTDELIELIATEPKICKYIDLPLQHIDDEILKSMRRPDRQADISNLLGKIRRLIPGVAIRTSFIVGFPGENDAHYNALTEFVKRTKFDHVGVFSYSQEDSTPAAKMPNQISDETKLERLEDLMAIQAEISESINQSHEGLILELLIEGSDEENPGVYFGRTYREGPDIDGKVYLETQEKLTPGTFVPVRIAQGFCYDSVAEPVEER